MLETKQIGNWTGILARLKNANLVMIGAENGFVGCCYPDISFLTLSKSASITTGLFENFGLIPFSLPRW